MPIGKANIRKHGSIALSSLLVDAKTVHAAAKELEGIDNEIIDL